MKGILGRKRGMTQVFAKNGKLIPVTKLLLMMAMMLYNLLLLIKKNQEAINLRLDI